MSEETVIASPSGATSPIKPSPETAQRCVACGYNLFGLGQEPRCPECGLLNIPIAYRQQVWELVDSGKWFFSSFFGVFRKRPAGWWWALDRAGDVRRSLNRGALCIAVSACLIAVVGAISGAVCLTWSVEFVSYKLGPNPTDPTIEWAEVYRSEWEFGIGGMTIAHWERTHEQWVPVKPGQSYKSSTRAAFRPSLSFVRPCSILFVLIVSLWACPAAAGIWTQIRKGLPAFARAPRTIIVASFYESHRVVYLSLLLCAYLAVDVLLRYQAYLGKPFSGAGGWLLATLALTIFGCCGWIGPLRSDYTKQLVRSRWHLIRILLMYGIFLPWLVTAAVDAAIFGPVLG